MTPSKRTSPLAILLFILLVVRMSLDYSSQYFAISVYDISITLSQALGISIALLGFLLAALRWQDLRRFPLVLPFLIIGLWGGISLLFSVEPKATAQDLLRVFDLFTVGLLAFTSIRTVSDFRKLLLAILLSFVVPIAVGFYQYAAGIGFSDENVDIPRIFGTFAHPNVFSLSLFAVFVLGFAFLTTFAKTRGEKILAILFLILSGSALLLTFSRVAWIALAFATLLLALWRSRILLVPLLALPVVLFFVSTDFHDRVLETLSPNPDSSVVWRQELWNDNVRNAQIDGRQWLGTGLETFPAVSEDLRGIRFGSNEAHNDFVKFFIEGGYVGLVAFVAYLLSILIIIVRGYRSADDRTMKAVFGFLLILFLSIELSALSDNVFKNTPLWWIFFATLGGALALVRTPATEK